MSKLETIKRCFLTINVLRNRKQATFQEINQAIEEEGFSEKIISLRTFQRDIADIDTLFGISIKFNRSTNSYYIQEDLSDEIAKLTIRRCYYSFG